MEYLKTGKNIIGAVGDPSRILLQGNIAGIAIIGDRIVKIVTASISCFSMVNGAMAGILFLLFVMGNDMIVCVQQPVQPQRGKISADVEKKQKG